MRNPAFKHKGIKKKATSYGYGGEGASESVIFTLYNTKIVTVSRHSVVLNHGEYRTVTTKRRMNEISKELGLGYYVFASKGEWYVAYQGHDYPFLGKQVFLSR